MTLIYLCDTMFIVVVVVRMARAHRLQTVPSTEAKPFLVDSPASRRQAVEPEQLPNRHDPGARWCGGHSRAHPLQGNLLPNVGGSLLGEGERLRGVNEIQEVDERTAIRSQPDSQQTIHPLVVTHHQQSKREPTFNNIIAFKCDWKRSFRDVTCLFHVSGVCRLSSAA